MTDTNTMRLAARSVLGALLLLLFAAPAELLAQDKQDCPMIEAGECFDATSAAKGITPPTPRAPQAFGDFLMTIPAPVSGTAVIVGLEHDGSGNLWNTDIAFDEAFNQTTAGGLNSTCSVATNSLGSLGITSVNGTLYITDVVGFEVDQYDTSCNYMSSFSVAAQTTFPEGITYNPDTGNLYVVDGAGGAKVSEYTTAGAHVADYPILGSSQDGIAYDAALCSYWIYDSGTDTVRQYDDTFNEVVNFPGTGANGLGGGEGLAVIGNRVYVTSPGAGVIGVFDVAGAVTQCPDADLGVEKGLDVNENRTGSYHIAVTNNGPVDATGVEVTDYLPGALTVTGSSTTQGTFDPETGIWDVGSLANGVTAELWINVTFNARGRYTNEVEVTDSDQSDPNPDNNSDEVSVVFIGDRIVPDFVPESGARGTTSRGDRFTADLLLDKSVDNDAPMAGDEITYAISVFNQGPQSTAKVEVTDVLPACLAFVSATADRGAYDAGTGVWALGKLKVGETATLDITVSTAGCSGEVVNTAEVTASSLPDPDDQFNIFDDPPVEDEIDTAVINVTARPLGLDGTTFALGANYPNPFNPATVVPFSLAEAATVSIKVYDLLGRSVATLVDGPMAAGVHEVRFEASQLPTGMYLVRMEAAGISKTMRVTLMK